jgi:hypothetical protein
MRRRKRLKLPAPLLPKVTVRGLAQYEDGKIDIDFSFNSTLVDAKRAAEFPLGKKFKLVPMP